MDKIFYEILDLLPVGVILADDKGRVVYINPSAIECMGITQKEIFGLNLSTIIHYQGSKKEMFLRTKANKMVPVRFSLHTLGDDRRLAILNNISEIHDLQQELLKMDRLASLGELTSGIAHEIRNPLAAMKTTAQALNEELGRYDHRREYVARIIKEIDRLNHLVLSFFDFAKPRALDLRECSLTSVTENAVYMVRDMARQNHVKIVEAYPEEDLFVKADQDMIQQVLMNILINAVQSMKTGGDLSLQMESDNEEARIVIKDTGKGIPDNLRSRIFDPFFTTKPKGVGLGLSVSYRIMRMHSGNITFFSDLGGTTFTVSLPVDIPES
ncbi:MAG: ATP-binding protein [Thermodesulfobacteriota bacterium]|nr:ATP-binding protein [Thermodesulfobacteriota bacterium]